MSANVNSVSDSYKHLLQGQGLSQAVFGDNVQSKCKEWKWNEDNDDANVASAAAAADSDRAIRSSEGSSADSRLVRDYVWIIRSAPHNGQRREYCDN
jgi:hypothetical protein